LSLLRFEWLKLRRAKRLWLTAAVLLVYLGLMLLGFYTYAQNETGGQAEFRYTFENRSYFNGLTFGLYAFYFGALMVLPIFAAAEGAAQIAGERRNGTLALMLLRQVSRSRLFLGKFALAALSQFVLVGLLLTLALGIGLALVGWGELNIYPGVLQMAETRQSLSQGEALRAFLLAWPAAALAMAAPLSLSFLLSSWMRSPINVVAASTALYLVMLVVSEIHFFADLRPILFTSYMGYWRELFRETVDWPTLLSQAAKLAVFPAAFLALGHWRFRTREEL